MMKQILKVCVKKLTGTLTKLAWMQPRIEANTKIAIKKKQKFKPFARPNKNYTTELSNTWKFSKANTYQNCL